MKERSGVDKHGLFNEEGLARTPRLRSWTVIIDRSGMESVENGGGRSARYALAGRRVVIFFGKVLDKSIIRKNETGVPW
jgi:hypothetical protein